MFRLAHISDIHLGPLPKVKRRELFSKRITGYVNFRRNRTNVDQPEITRNLVTYLKNLEPDHTAITGDLINLGLNEEITNAAVWLNELGDPADNTVVLGNHDAYVRGARDRAMQAWQAFLCGDDGRHISSDKDYPVLRRRGSVSIIGCNSARASAPFLATGYFKKDQGEKLAHLLKEEGAAGQCRIVLIHHAAFRDATPRHKRLIGLKNLMRAVRLSGAELILHGHTHLATLESIEGHNGPVPVICVPAAYQWAGHKKPPAGLNLFEIEKSDGNWQITMERHSLTHNGEQSFRLATRQIIAGKQ